MTNQKLRTLYQPLFPQELSDPSTVGFIKEETLATLPEIQKVFPLSSHQPILSACTEKKINSKPITLGVVFSGGPAPGGHNVLAGLLDTLKKLHAESLLLGVLDGPEGLIEGNIQEIKEEELKNYRNQGGFDFLGSGRTKIETEEQLQKSLQVVQRFGIQGVIIIGGDDSHTNAAVLSEYFSKHGSSTKVVGVPKTIDGDLANKYAPLSFGFDTATKVYSEMIGNLARDALSSRKYYHFVKLMGRSASHVTLECALSVQPNLVFISEERKTLKMIVEEIVDLVMQRATQDKNWGVILVPEGLIEFMPDAGDLLQEPLPLEKDPHGNINVSAIETDVLLINRVTRELKERGFKPPFAAVPHFFGYEGRCAMPSNFDANYCYTLGITAALLVARGFTSYMCCVRNLQDPPHRWRAGGVPLTSLMHFEMRNERKKAVIAKALVDLKGRSYLHYKSLKDKWKEEDCYLYPGPIQFFGEPSVTDKIPEILRTF